MILFADRTGLIIVLVRALTAERGAAVKSTEGCSLGGAELKKEAAPVRGTAFHP